MDDPQTPQDPQTPVTPTDDQTPVTPTVDTPPVPETPVGEQPTQEETPTPTPVV